MDHAGPVQGARLRVGNQKQVEPNSPSGRAHNNAAESSLTEFFRTRKKDGLVRRGSVDPHLTTVLPERQDSQFAGPAAARSGPRITRLLRVEGGDEVGSARLPGIHHALAPPAGSVITETVAGSHQGIEIR